MVSWAGELNALDLRPLIRNLSSPISIAGSALLSPKFKSTGFSNNLEGRFYENNGMEASKIKKKLKKLDQAKRQKK